MKALVRIAVVGLLACVAAARAQESFAFTTLAGSWGHSGSSDGVGSHASFSYNERCLTVDAAGNVYVGDGFAVRKITPAAVVTTLAGVVDQTGSVDGVGADARFGAIYGVAVDAAGNVYVTDANHTVRKITPAGLVTTVAGSAGQTGYTDGVGALARFAFPTGVAVDAEGNLYVADSANQTIRRITPAGSVSTFVGSPQLSGSQDGTGAAARFYYPGSIALNASGTIYVVDVGNRLIRQITPAGVVTTLAGSIEATTSYSYADDAGPAARFSGPQGLAVDPAGNLYFGEYLHHTIRRVTPAGVVTTVAGNFQQPGSADGVGGAASFAYIGGVAADATGNLYVADTGNTTVRKGVPTTAISPPIITVSAYSQNQSLVAGGQAVFQAAVSSNQPVTCQWFHDGAAIAGVTAPTLKLTPLSAADAGTYSVTATNAGGSRSVTLGTLTVFTPPLTMFATQHRAAGGSFLWGVAAGDGTFVAVGTGGKILSSADGETWTPRVSGTDAWLVGVAYGAGKFVAVGEAGSILLSPDGQTWAPAAASGTTERLNNIVYGAGTFVAVGEAGTVVTSTDAQTWTKQTLPASYQGTGWLRGLAYNPSSMITQNWNGAEVTTKAFFAATGQNGVLFYSGDGVTWRLGGGVLLNGINQDAEALVPVSSYGGFAGVGQDGAVFSATLQGGYHWSSGPYQTFNAGALSTGSAARLRGIAVGANALFAMGENGAVLSAPSPDGPWTALQTGTTANLVAGVFVGNSLYVVGENETILRSTPLTTSRLVNISSRGFAGKDDATLISGFVVQGTQPKQMLLRAVGPGLTRAAGLTGVVATPQLTLTNAAGTVLATNRGWATAGNAAEIVTAAATVGAFPLASEDSDAALLVTLDPGRYTAQVSGQEGASGLCLIEAYDADAADNAGARAINISTRAQVGTGDNILIAGFVIAGDSARRVLIRGAGPALHARFGMNGILTAPQLTLSNHAGKTLQTAAAWSEQLNADEIRDAAKRVGAFDFDEGSADAALVVTLLPGIYTVQVAGADGGSGVALVEVYDLP